MNELAVTIALPPELSTAEREELLLILEPLGKAQEPQNRVLVPDWATVTLILKAVAAGASAGTALLKFAAELAKWRRGLRAKKIKCAAELRHPHLEPLKLATASDEEIEKWLLLLNTSK